MRRTRISPAAARTGRPFVDTVLYLIPSLVFKLIGYFGIDLLFFEFFPDP